MASLAAFILGHLLGFPGVASIGAIMLVLVGGDVLLNDIQVKTGENIDRDYSTVGNEPVENQTTVNNTYDTHAWTDTFASNNAISLGVFQALIGVLLFYNQWESMAE